MGRDGAAGHRGTAGDRGRDLRPGDRDRGDRDRGDRDPGDRGRGGFRARTSAIATAAILAAILGCGGADGGSPVPGADRAAFAVEVVDDAGRPIRLEAPAARIVSLVPSVTETVLALDGPGRLVARTRYDEDPRIADLPSVGGGLDPSVESVVALDPDLVVGWNSGEGRLAARLEAVGIPFYAAAVEDTAAVFETIRRVGALIGRPAAADSVAGALSDTLAAIAAESGGSAPTTGVGGPTGVGRPSVFYWMAGDPPRTAGRATFIGEAIGVAGGTVAFPELDALWPAVSLEAVVARDPDVIVVPVGDGLPGAGTLSETAGWRELTAVREGRVVEIDADLFARPGPRLGAATRALRRGLVGVLPR